MHVEHILLVRIVLRWYAQQYEQYILNAEITFKLQLKHVYFDYYSQVVHSKPISPILMWPNCLGAIFCCSIFFAISNFKAKCTSKFDAATS